MRKRLAAFLAVILLAVISPAGAEYKSYRITEGNWWRCFPLDAHNTVAACRLWLEDSEPNPWYICWYRDGELYRELTGEIPAGDRTGRMLMPYPAIWDGEHLSLYYCVLKEELKTSQQGTWVPTPDPGCFDVYLADWAEDGLENEHILPEAWFDTYEHTDRGMLVYSGEKGRTALYNSKETVLPDSIPVNLKENIIRILPVDEDVYLVKTMDNESLSSGMVCVDHGVERYRITLPRSEVLAGSFLMPDRQGGFFCIEGHRPGDYTPEYLAHYRGDGQYDRTLALSGNRVVVHVWVSTAGPDSGFCTLYGSAVAASRKVYTVFAMTLDEELNVRKLDVRKIDPAYGDYDPEILIASDGTPYVFIECYSKKRSLWPVLIPFDALQKSKKTYGIKLAQ